MSGHAIGGWPDVVDDLAAQHAELDAVLTGISEEQWRRPSPCPGWDVSDVVLHLHQTDEWASASLGGALDAAIEESMRPAGAVDAVAGAAVAEARGATPAALLDGWRGSARALTSRLRGDDPRRRVQWVVGTLSVHTLAVTRLAECWVHTTDVAAAVGTELVPSARLAPIARLAWRTVPYAFERAGVALHGPVGFDLIGTDGSSWQFGMDLGPATVVAGPAVDLCRVAGQRADAAATALTATGPDADTVLGLVRTFA